MNQKIKDYNYEVSDDGEELNKLCEDTSLLAGFSGGRKVIVHNFLHDSNLRVAKSLLQRVREEIGEDEYPEKFLGDSPVRPSHEYTARSSRNQEKARIRLACDTIERELEGDCG